MCTNIKYMDIQQDCIVTALYMTIGDFEKVNAILELADKLVQDRLQEAGRE